LLLVSLGHPFYDMTYAVQHIKKILPDSERVPLGVGIVWSHHLARRQHWTNYPNT